MFHSLFPSRTKCFMCFPFAFCLSHWTRMTSPPKRSRGKLRVHDDDYNRFYQNGRLNGWVRPSWAIKCAHQVDQSVLASLAPKVRVIQYPMNCRPKLIKLVLCSSRLRHNAWTTSAPSALSSGSVEILWVVFLKHCLFFFTKKCQFSFIFYVRWLTKMLFHHSNFWSRILHVFKKVNLCFTCTRDFHAIHNCTYQEKAVQCYRNQHWKPVSYHTGGAGGEGGDGGEGGGGLRTPWPLPPWWPRPQ